MDRRTALRTLALLGAAACTREPLGADPPSSAPPRTVPPTPSSSAADSAVPATPDPVPSSSPTVAVEPTTAPATLDLLCREAWGARPAGGTMRPHEVGRLTVHHSAARLDDRARGPGQLRSHQAFHMDGQGWADLAYHVSIDRGGVLYMGRRWDRAGDTGTSYDPAGHLLVLLDGNFDVQEPSAEQLDTAARTLAWAANHFGVGLDTVSGHRDHAATSCPGDALYARLADLVGAARDLVGAGGVALSERCGPEAAAFVAEVEAGRT